MKLLVILDNGHGKNTKGKCSPDKSLYEWSWTREIVEMIYESLMTCGIQAYMLVPEEKDISLSERVRREKRVTKQATSSGFHPILISVHVNASGGDGKWKTPNGWTGWIAQGASEYSKKLAQLLYQEATNLKLKGDRCVPKTKYWTANYTITTDTSCPAVLTENLFMDNQDNCQYLLSDKGKATIVKLHVNAIKKYNELVNKSSKEVTTV